MKLISCHIENFGKLQDVTVDFDGKLHMIMESNGWGKSTLAAFIKVMFYGFSNEGKKSIAENERKRYRPWQGGVYGGWLVFETDGRSYQIERTFGAKDKEDTFALYDTVTNTISGDFSSNIGEELFRIDGTSFGRTIYIAQGDCATEATDSISAKLGNLAENTDDINNYDNVQKKLKDMLNNMSPTRVTGSIKILDMRIGNLRADVLRGDELEGAVGQLDEKLRREGDRREALKHSQADVQEAIEKASVYRELVAKKYNYDKICVSLHEKEEKLSEMEKYAAGMNYDDAPDMKELQQAIRDWGVRNEKKNQLVSKKKAAADISAAAAAKKGSIRWPLMAAGIVLVLLGIAAAAMTYMTGTAVAAAGVIMIIASCVCRKQNADMSENDEWVLLCNEIEEAESNIADVDDYIRRLLGMCGMEYNEDNVLDALYDIKSRMQMKEHYDRAAEDVMRARNEKASFEAENDMENILNIDMDAGIQPLENLNTELRGISEELESVNDNIASYIRQREDLQRELDDMAENEELLEDMEQEKIEKLHSYEILSLTRKYLEQAKESFTSRYADPVMSAFEKYYGMLSGEDVSHYTIDANIDIKLREKGERRDIRLLSRGYQDLAGVCMRMALIDAMYREEKPFIIFDDSFVNMDDVKVRHGMELLDRISEEYQVIYFTCHESRGVNKNS